jgi:biotin/methionine sulfoxide reductase
MMTPRDPYLVAMDAVVPPHAQARDDYAILAGISSRLGVDHLFTEGRSADEWLQWLYDNSKKMAAECGVSLPDVAAFNAKGWHYIEPGHASSGALEAFRKDPRAAPLKTRSGLIEICCEHIAVSCQGNILPHPAWYAPEEWLGNVSGQHRFHLISGQPADKLHSQLDHGPQSQAAKIDGRTVACINPIDAKTLGVCDGDVLRVYNDRGACLVSARLDPSLMKGCITISTGAWLDAAQQGDGTLICLNGNPNTLTRDQGTSRLAQGPTAHSCLVSLEKADIEFGHLRAYLPPKIHLG